MLINGLSHSRDTQEDTQQEKKEGEGQGEAAGRMRYSAHATHLIAGAGMGQKGNLCAWENSLW